MRLAIGLLDHFIVNLSSVLVIIPTRVITPVYNGTKASLHFESMNLRIQLKDTNFRVEEMALPTVAKDLHREKGGSR